MAASEQPEDDRGRPALGWPAPLLDLVHAVAESWRLAVAAGASVVCGVVVWLLCATPYYIASAVAVLMPREKPTLDVSVRTGIIETAEDSARRSETGSMMLPPQPGLYMELLGSDRVRSSIAERFRNRLADPVERLKTVELVSELGKMVKVVGTEEGLLTVEVTAYDAKLAADVANAFIEEGEDASRQIERQLLEDQTRHLKHAVDRVSRDLARDEEELSTFYSKRRLIDPARESSETLRQIRETKMVRDSLTRQLAERSVSYTESDSVVQSLHAQVDTANRRIEELENHVVGVGTSVNYGSLMVDHERIQQRVRANRDLLQTLKTQYEVYRVRAEQPSGSLVTIKRAAPPSGPAGPRKKRTLSISILIALAMAVGISLLRQQWRHAMRQDYCAGRITDIRSQLRRGGRGPVSP